MAGELLLPAIITFLAYFLAFVLGVVVTILLLIHELVREEKIDKQEPGPKRNEALQEFQYASIK